LRRAAGDLVRPPPAPSSAAYDLTTAVGVDCTRCDAPMQSIVVDARTLIDRCRGCGLIWIDAGELAPLAGFVRRNLGNARPPSDFEELLASPDRLREHAARAERRAETGEGVRETAWWVTVALSLFGW
jgi:Zn-finger nucleic acid-binding protein